MIEIYPPYTTEQLASFADNVDCEPREGYPTLERRLFWAPADIDRHVRGNVLRLPPGHDALNSPNRTGAPEGVQAGMDPEIVTGSPYAFSPLVAYGPDQIRDQHNRPIHPGFRQLLSLLSADGRRLGMPTGIGAFYRYGGNGVADNAGMYRKGKNGEDETLLIRRPGTPQSPRGGWATPGGYEERDDLTAGEASAVAGARRETEEETGIRPEGRGRIVARMLPISSIHTLNAWSETHAVIFPDEDQDRLHDIEPVAGDGVEDVRWFRVRDIVTGEVEMWSQDHVLYIREGYKEYERD